MKKALKQNNNRPDSPEVIARVIERVSRMTPEEALAFLEYRREGVEETWTVQKPKNGSRPRKASPAASGAVNSDGTHETQAS